MQPLNLLTNVQKARLLHSLLTDEIPNFLAFLNEQTESVLNNKDKLITVWKDQMFSIEMWFALAEEVQRILAKYNKQLDHSPNLFADQLFDGYNGIYVAHGLLQYVTLGKHNDPKFKHAVDLLFT
ncbi:hypothetical protein FO440_18260 [Mucilaginibacter corticis]|uniref:Uncharacterized protein n=1 Tax=Mucilaginibacter corticis TaxID=2597670 RepID=A0A556MIJ5_9SPHI|nr:hypothetical protein [Mucilaginibacter corticis]TSJ39683.1 hypothetical protein FO440_18260 [Mucilaginibacter corticis]